MRFTNETSLGASVDAGQGTPRKRPRIYISGPMSGLPEHNFPAFHAAEAWLSACGWEPLNPARNFAGRLDLAREVYMREDFENLLRAEALYLLPGWEHSVGAKIERTIARELGLAIIYATDAAWETPAQPAFTVADELFMDGAGPAKPPAEPVATYPPPQPESILIEAQRLIHGDRNHQYGHPLEDFSRTGRIWGAVLGIPPITAEKVALCLAGVKLSRATNELDAGRPIKRDTVTDIAGYAGTIEMVQEKREAHSAQTA